MRKDLTNAQCISAAQYSETGFTDIADKEDFFSPFHLRVSHISEERTGAVPFHMLENTQWKLVFPSHSMNQ